MSESFIFLTFFVSIAKSQVAKTELLYQAQSKAPSFLLANMFGCSVDTWNTVNIYKLQVVSSAIVDKYIGESARLIREMFAFARDHQPCIIFMDEIDAIGGRRFSEGTSADREIQRTLMEVCSSDH